ncbi:MAG TPA: pyridoxal phosphate-dependent aminotransferase [Vicinamibacterales bacterium]|nr:pyridoxal phosphate-dependent aminotransferase [Vicinamibacterales bacterium]
MFSKRFPRHAEINELTRTLQRLRAEGASITDLTDSNPTRVGVTYPDDLLDDLSSEAARRYEPHSLGLRSAREAVAADYGRRGARVDPDHVVLSASTSEAYSWIFKLLCDPGQAVLVPEPSYPLFEHLTGAEGVKAVAYQLRYHGRWEIDIDSLAAAPSDTRAVLLVSPNNPTGSFVSRLEANRMAALCRERGWAIVADEVFADYALDEAAAVTECAMNLGVLSLTLGGASKTLGLPQVKLAWMVVDGPPADRDRALGALELIADMYLSVSTPVQVAAPSLLARGEAIRRQIRARVAANLARARQLIPRYPACTPLPVEGGWSLVVRVPSTRSEEALVLDLLERERILVHPGYFFDFPHEAFIVVSLLPPEEVFADALDRALCVATSVGGGRP